MTLRSRWPRLATTALTLGLALTSLPALSQTTPQYVTPADAGPHGSAPKMQVRLISHPGETPQYAVVFGKGDDPFAGLTRFAQQYHVQSAHFTAIGAFHDVRLAWFDASRRAYKVIPVDQQVEVASLIGDVGLVNGKPSVHMHCVVADQNGNAHAGHILGAHVFPTLEVYVTVDPVPTIKTRDPETGLSLFSLDSKQ